MIKAIEIENFKSFKKKTRININQLSLFSGLNSSGKSTIAQVLLLLKQSIDETDNYNNKAYLKINGSSVQFGKSEEVLNDEKKQSFNISILYNDGTIIKNEYSWDKNREEQEGIKEQNYLLISQFYLKQKNSLVEATWNREAWDIKGKTCFNFADNNIFYILKSYLSEVLKVKFNGNNYNNFLSSNVTFSKIKKTDIIFSYQMLSHFFIDIKDIKNCVITKYRRIFDETKFIEFAKTRGYKKNTVEIQFPLFEYYNYIREIRNIFYIGPFRGMPQRIYTNNNPMFGINQDLDKKIYYKYDFNEQRGKENSLRNAILYWFNNEFHLGKNIVNKEKDFVSEIMIQQNKKQIAINNVGFGVSQILPLLLQLLQNKDGLYIVDEPECHLHPGLQTKIGFFLINMALLGKKIIVETHSEHIINIVNYYSIKYPLIKKQITMFWVSIKNNSSKVTEIKYDELGYPINTPEGFYDEIDKTIEKLSEIRGKILLG